jgi:hypothetical protein
MDGSASVADIGRRLKEEFGPASEPVFARLMAYLGALEQQRLIVRV